MCAKSAKTNRLELSYCTHIKTSDMQLRMCNQPLHCLFRMNLYRHFSQKSLTFQLSAEDTGLSEDATKQVNKAVAAELQKCSIKSITGTARKRKRHPLLGLHR